jgi:hypothetical protein
VYSDTWRCQLEFAGDALEIDLPFSGFLLLLIVVDEYCLIANSIPLAGQFREMVWFVGVFAIIGSLTV